MNVCSLTWTTILVKSLSYCRSRFVNLKYDLNGQQIFKKRILMLRTDWCLRPSWVTEVPAKYSPVGWKRYNSSALPKFLRFLEPQKRDQQCHCKDTTSDPVQGNTLHENILYFLSDNALSSCENKMFQATVTLKMDRFWVWPDHLPQILINSVFYYNNTTVLSKYLQKYSFPSSFDVTTSSPL